jgi:predicted DNA-binding protein
LSSAIEALVLRACHKRNTIDSMKTLTVKLPEQTLKQLKDEAHATGRSVAALVRERIETPPQDQSFHALAGDLAGSLSGSPKAATNKRRKFERS